MVPNPHLRNWAAQVALTAAATAAVVKAPDAATDYVYVTKVVLMISVVANGKKTLFGDSTPTSYWSYTDLTVATGINQTGSASYDFGRRGVRMAVGKNFVALGEASGSAGFVYAEGYQSSI